MSSCSDEFLDAEDFLSSSPPGSPANLEETKRLDASVEHQDGEEKSTDDKILEEESLTVQEIEKRRDDAVAIKDEGNLLFKSGSFSEALVKYTEALDLCPLKCGVERSVIYANRAACHIKLDSPEAAILDCNESLNLQPDYMRCLERRATLLESKDRLSDALEDYKKILQFDPSNQKARYACATLPERIRIQNEKMKEEMLGQLKQLGNLILKPFGLSTDNFKVQKNPESEGYSINFVQNASTSSQ
uniref:SJCHGC04914 protein n=1 Tax=Schistosoma japonicum TaxID=6182 RepID=Q5DI25_SCHJA|nr:SJCHGC04914 protein [Schistosoma japonicum]